MNIIIVIVTVGVAVALSKGSTAVASIISACVFAVLGTLAHKNGFTKINHSMFAWMVAALLIALLSWLFDF